MKTDTSPDSRGGINAYRSKLFDKEIYTLEGKKKSF